MSVRGPEFAKVVMTAHVADDSWGRGLTILQVVKLESLLGADHSAVLPQNCGTLRLLCRTLLSCPVLYPLNK